MKARRDYISAAVLALICLGASGCAVSATARLSATRLRAAVVQDEQLVDINIAQQKQFYEQQSTLIANARAVNIQFNVDSFRRARSARLATTMSLDPDKEARLSNLMDSLLETHDQEFQLWQKLYGGDQQAREQLQTKIAGLERQKKVLAQVKDNLNQLGLASSSKKQAQMLLKFSQDTYDAYKKTSK